MYFVHSKAHWTIANYSNSIWFSSIHTHTQRWHARLCWQPHEDQCFHCNEQSKQRTHLHTVKHSHGRCSHRCNWLHYDSALCGYFSFKTDFVWYGLCCALLVVFLLNFIPFSSNSFLFPIIVRFGSRFPILSQANICGDFCSVLHLGEAKIIGVCVCAVNLKFSLIENGNFHRFPYSIFRLI